MMLARKWDRLENYMQANGYDVFVEDEREESIDADLVDLTGYLLLVLEERKKNAVRYVSSPVGMASESFSPAGYDYRHDSN